LTVAEYPLTIPGYDNANEGSYRVARGTEWSSVDVGVFQE